MPSIGPNTISGPPAGLPAVSICIPTYNGKQYLSECINSIIAQTFGDFEVLICDDQSSDGTLDYARELAKGDKRFRFISNPRRFGLVGNWNNCVQQARGEWIKFVFQDDVISPSCLEMLLAACRREGKLFGFCERDFIFEDGTSETQRQWLAKHQQKLRSDYKAGVVISEEQAARLAAKEPSHNPVGEPTVTLINRKVFQELGGFDESLIQLCDAEFWFRVMINYGAVFVPQSLALFRIHSEATTAKNVAQREFRTMVLDPLVLKYQFAFGRHFEPARNPQITGKSIAAFREECSLNAAAAWSQVRNGNHSGSFFEEWEKITSCYPGLQTAARRGRVLALWQRLKGGIRRRLKFA